ncbi:MerR family transcriptional regulator [Paenibacillus sp. IITD108]|uniref:MerR family transcriptional regulator n=1 Tax=Paenibacillus sp. IITD108 TaxID=3116649 RepID=UPI002F3E6182
MRISELADAAGVTKRTIDYYTQLGLLEVKKSENNYRHYPKDCIERLITIERLKKQGFSLQDIKHQFENPVPKAAECQTHEEIDIYELRAKIHLLNKEVQQFITNNELADEKDLKKMNKLLRNDSVALMQTILLLLS